MARIRTLKPTFWTDGKVISVSPQARLLFEGTWTFALCDYGHVADDARQLQLQVLPADTHMMVRDAAGGWTVAPMDPEALVAELLEVGLLERITAGGRTYLHAVRFTEHQKLEKRWTPRCPACRNLAEPPGTSTNLSETPRPSAPDRTGQDGTTAAAAAGGANDAAAAAEDLPTAIAILRDKLQAHTPLRALRFDRLRPDQTDQLVALIETHGDAALVDTALRTLRATPPVHVSAFIGTWAALPPPGQRLAVVRQQLCVVHGTKRSPSGVCSACVSEHLEVGS